MAGLLDSCSLSDTKEKVPDVYAFRTLAFSREAYERSMIIRRLLASRSETKPFEQPMLMQREQCPICQTEIPQS
jgi:hypothetical protein